MYAVESVVVFKFMLQMAIGFGQSLQNFQIISGSYISFYQVQINFINNGIFFVFQFQAFNNIQIQIIRQLFQMLILEQYVYFQIQGIKRGFQIRISGVFQYSNFQYGGLYYRFVFDIFIFTSRLDFSNFLRVTNQSFMFIYFIIFIFFTNFDISDKFLFSYFGRSVQVVQFIFQFVLQYNQVFLQF